MTQSLSRRVVAITGALGNLGETLADMAAAQGADLVLIDQATIGLPTSHNRLVLSGVDLASLADCQDVARQINRYFGRLDALVNGAGGYAWEPLLGGTIDAWDRLYTLNLRTALNASKTLLPLLLQSSAGRIVNIGASMAAKAGLGMGAYAASKSSVLRLTESLAEELKDMSITVNAVLPSILDTPQNREAMPDAEHQRWVTPAQLAAVILFLISEQASAVTGTGIPVIGRM
ncbi:MULTISPECIES: SDR family NAD(P)-dependent oxidoreductase [unclassified Pseudomonas]|uniref:SDR family NAD(P)-dependent oxidoreductase n=1 Tax=unclassified Pseudomonas TaxID=196821 RepID=UPI000C81B82E|nr:MULTISPECIES: SDR family NAD(P)-dependent oxidoreductase [unclassified Pseudomonas]MDX9669397.1 SDR family NAD(P)-dependent oxidoreductase [Pseudomonas sp. P8_250]PMQ10419.1 (S)-1-Phenylethanol dehydrogenase [Pseudomonas sp. AD21]WPN36564.1 SDR family NAD(P)-dependent oxidoreductase [Pseudomonas sp. P8_139]WPN41635.1 SDR family NAD(P)-dependent oxidoreductase [Pseudomonas sp. P8_229]